MKDCLFFLAWLFFAAVSHASPPFAHTETGISLPDRIAGLIRGKVTAYEGSPSEAGVAIPFQSDEVEITVFIRHLDPKKVSSPALVVDESLEAVKQMEASGTYSNVKIFKSVDDSGMPGWSKGAFTAKNDQAFVMSLIYATIKAEHAIKVRITTANPKNDSIGKFVSEFQKIVNDAKPKR